MRKFKRITSIILATLMVMSLFAAVPMTVNAAPPGESGSGTEIGGSTTVITPAADGDYLTFTAEEAGSSVTLNVSTGSNLLYNKNNSGWQSYTAGTPIGLENEGDYVRFRGKDTTFSNSKHVSIGGKVACSGNVMSLRLDDYGEVQGLSDSCFNSMFMDCAGLTAAPELPETILAYNCYNSMFKGCTSLTTAPELPATSLAGYCYYNMFSGCTSLTTAPELWATSLAIYCYNNMFSGCTSLTTAPELPATTLAESCYNYMFYACTSLTTAPELPATTLERSCYNNMFSGCRSLTTAPELPATELAETCYNYMFEGCTSLTTAPELPATTLAPYCYNSMFKGCGRLTTAPELPATTLADNCYSNMFSGCTNLTTAPELWATSLAYNCYSYMFNGCTSLTTAPELPATTLDSGCYSAMFAGCTSLTTAPELPATTLVYNCYSFMFYGCSSIKLSETRIDKYRIPYSVPSGGNGTTASSALYSMFAGTGGTFTGTPAINKTYYMYSEVPEGINYGGDNYIDPKGTQEVNNSDEGKTKFGLDLDNYLNMQMLGIQLKNSIATEGGADGVRFVTAVNSNLLKGSNIEDYGYIVAKFNANVEDLNTNMDKFTADKFSEDENKFSCKGTSNSISGEFGQYSTETDYKYVTLSVTGTSEQSGNLIARFYVKTKDGKYHYADYINGNSETNSGMAFDLSAVEANLH